MTHLPRSYQSSWLFPLLFRSMKPDPKGLTCSPPITLQAPPPPSTEDSAPSDLMPQLQVAQTEPRSQVSGPLAPPRPLALPRFSSCVSEMWLRLPLCQPTSHPIYLIAPHSGCHHALLRFLSQSCVSVCLLHAIHYPATRGRCLNRDSDYGTPCLQSLCGCPRPRKAPCSGQSGAHRLHLPLRSSLPLPHSGLSLHLPNCSSSRESCFTNFFFL